MKLVIGASEKPLGLARASRALGRERTKVEKAHIKTSHGRAISESTHQMGMVA